MALSANNVVDREARMDEQVTDEQEPLAGEELLVEEVSIDGMCGVY
jgi:mycofactocin precursor